MKTTALIGLLLAASATSVLASEASRPVNLDFLDSLLQQKLASGVVHSPRIVIDVRHPNRPPAKGWHYIDALYCGWSYNNGNSYNYAYDGTSVVYDTGPDHALATAIAIPCVHGYLLGYHIIADGTYDKTESFTYP